MEPLPEGSGRRGGSASDHTRNPASMEPLPEGSGREAAAAQAAQAATTLQWSRFPKEAEGCLRNQQRRPVLRFNGAASRRKRKDYSAPPSLPPHQSFNGAASRRKRKEMSQQNAAPRTSTLQWSRFPKEAEGPHPVSRRCPVNCFNGAASRRKRKGRPAALRLFSYRGASMEPLPEGSGRRGAESPARRRGPTLQWSRFPKEAEGVLTRDKGCERSQLQWSRFPKEAEGLRPAGR